MTDYNLSPTRFRRAGVIACLVFCAACGATRPLVPADATRPDQYLFDLANNALKKEDWLKARQYFQQVVDNYPGSPLRPDAKLGVGDAYLGEGTTESTILSGNEFREFLTFYPTSPRADYAQYKLAMSHFRQMRSADRDQTETKDALKEFQTFFDRYPNSSLMPEVRKDWRVARDRLSEASYLVGLHYFHARWYPGAIDRFHEVLTEDPGYTHRDDVYFYLAESLARTDKKAEAIPYFERLLTEFDGSEHVEDTRKRLEELKTQ